MKNGAVTSLRKYRAQRYFDRYYLLPSSQRTNARSAMLIEAIIDYAYDHVPREQVLSSREIKATPEDALRISRRLREFMPPSPNKTDKPIMNWLHDNLVPEAWSYPEDMGNLMADMLRER